MKRFSVSLFFLFLFSITTWAQQRSGFGLNLFPNYSGRRLVAFDEFGEAQRDSLEAAERTRPTYALGVVLNSRSEKVGVQIGLNYSRAGYTSKRSDLPPNSPQRPTFSEQRYGFLSHQLEVPFSVQFYQALSDKDEFFFSMGSGVSVTLQNRDEWTYYAGDFSEGTNTKAVGDFRAMSYAFQAGMGWERRWSESLVMSVAPTFRLWLAGINKEGSLNRNLYQMGIRMTFRWERER